MHWGRRTCSEAHLGAIPVSSSWGRFPHALDLGAAIQCGVGWSERLKRPKGRGVWGLSGGKFKAGAVSKTEPQSASGMIPSAFHLTAAALL